MVDALRLTPTLKALVANKMTVGVLAKSGWSSANAVAVPQAAMLAIMIAPTVGIDPFTVSFIAQLLAVVTLGSIGVAGVGGGATFAALIVLSTMNLPVALAGLLISVEPLIDMGRTALNVSGAITAGTVVSRALGETDLAVFDSDATPDLDSPAQTA